ncbi:SRPBCC domain-containing protein [Nannocystaceae bacterium ST9]
MTEPAGFHHTLYIRCRPSELWAALTEGEQTRRWFLGTTIDSSFEIGAPVRFLALAPDQDDDEPRVEAIRGSLRAFDPPRRLVHELRFCDLDDPAGEVEWALSEPAPEAGVVRLDVEHRGLIADSPSWTRAREGWPLILSGLKTWLETSAPLGLTKP